MQSNHIPQFRPVFVEGSTSSTSSTTTTTVPTPTGPAPTAHVPQTAPYHHPMMNNFALYSNYLVPANHPMMQTVPPGYVPYLIPAPHLSSHPSTAAPSMPKAAHLQSTIVGNNNNQPVYRKGKWTPEEEKYTNKVIEYFNAGLLKIDEQDRNITLRAYLAEKLGCDPMRITKKYTGSSCLGKRVYNFDYVQVSPEEIEKAKVELLRLERAFKQKLEQMSQRRFNDLHSTLEECHTVSTPSIDALMQQTKSQRQKVIDSTAAVKAALISNPQNGVDKLNYEKQAVVRGALPPYYMPYHYPQQMYTYPTMMSYPANGFLVPTANCNNISKSNSTTGPSSESSSDEEKKKAEKPHLAITFESTDSAVQEFTSDFWSPLKTIAHNEEVAESEDKISSSDKDNVASDDETTAENSVATSSAEEPKSTAKRTLDTLEDNQASSNKKVKIDVLAEQTLVGNSFLGFISNINKIGSQEDLVGFLEGVQKSVTTTCNSSSKASSGIVKSTSFVSRGSVDSFQKLITPSMGIM